MLTKNPQKSQQQETARSEEEVGSTTDQKSSIGSEEWPLYLMCSSSHPLGPLVGNMQCPEGIMEILTSWNECVPEHMEDTLVIPEILILVGFFEGLLDLVKKEMWS